MRVAPSFYGPAASVDMYLVEVTAIVECNALVSGMTFHKKCRECNRYAFTAGFPTVSSFVTQAPLGSVFAPSLLIEAKYGSMEFYYAHADVASCLERHKLEGLCISSAGS